MSHSGLLFKLKSIGVGGSVLSICTEFLSDRWQRVVLDGAASERTPMISGVPQGSVLSTLLNCKLDTSVRINDECAYQ